MTAGEVTVSRTLAYLLRYANTDTAPSIPHMSSSPQARRLALTEATLRHVIANSCGKHGTRRYSIGASTGLVTAVPKAFHGCKGSKGSDVRLRRQGKSKASGEKKGGYAD